MASGDELDDGDRRTSPNGRCQVGAFQSGLFLACDGRTVWTTKPAPVGYGSTLVGLTRTSVPGSYLVVQDDGNLVVRAPDGRPVWSRLTGPHPLTPCSTPVWLSGRLGTPVP